MIRYIARFGLAGLSLSAMHCLPVRAQHPVAILRATYPTVRMVNGGRNHSYCFGTEMTAGSTEELAATAFLAQHGAAFGGPLQAEGPNAGLPEVSPHWNRASRDGSFVCLAYRQKIRGKEVDGAGIRIKVRHGPVPRVNYAAARLSGEPTLGLETPLISAQVASMTVQALSGIQGISVQGTPEVVVLRGSTRRPDAWCWRVQTKAGQEPFAKERTYYVDTSYPRIVHVVERFWHFRDPPTTGYVEASGTTASPPYLPYQGSSASLVTHRIPGMRVTGTAGGGESVFTNGNGEFSLGLGSGNEATTVGATFFDTAQWYRVYTLPGVPTPQDFLAASAATTVGASVPLALSNDNWPEENREEFEVGQTNSVVNANRARSFFLQYISSSTPTLLYIIPNTVDVAGQCGGAITSGNTYRILFSPQNAIWWNCASPLVVCHEYGHMALDYIGLDAATYPLFHEGYADTYSFMVNDSSVMGPQQHRSYANMRDNPVGINCQYPLSQHSAPLDCECEAAYGNAALISGPWVRIRDGLKSYFGTTTGLAYARTFFGNWSLITLGGDDECGSAHPGTLAEVLNAPSELDDNPVYASIILSSFAAHNICPDGPCN